jgi:hypothetical protein
MQRNGVPLPTIGGSLLDPVWMSWARLERTDKPLGNHEHQRQTAKASMRFWRQAMEEHAPLGPLPLTERLRAESAQRHLGILLGGLVQKFCEPLSLPLQMGIEECASVSAGDLHRPQLREAFRRI